MCAMLVCACSVLLDFYDFQSFTILHDLDTLHPQLLKILNLRHNLKWLYHGTVHVHA